MPNPPHALDLSVGERLELGKELLHRGVRDLARLQRTRGAYRKTAKRIERAAVVVALAAALLGIPLAEPATAVESPVFLSGFFAGFRPVPTFADIDDDGDLDGFVCELDDGGDTKFFENTGAQDAPLFAAPLTNPFGLPGGIDNVPRFSDIDGDGDLDAFVGEDVILGAGYQYRSIVLLENTGTTNAPSFAAPLTNPFGLSDVQYGYGVPAFADVDGDGDLDAFLGEVYGDTVFFENTGAANAPAFDAPVTNPFGLSQVAGGLGAPIPTFVDIDGDGDLDAFAGVYVWSGGVHDNTVFFENTGTANAPTFAAPVTNPFGFTDVGYVFAAPAFADIEGDGDLDAFIGESLSDSVHFFENAGSVVSPAFRPAGGPFGLSDVGALAAPALVDIDADGDLDAFVGESDADLLFFANAGTPAAASFVAPTTDPFGLTTEFTSVKPELADLDGDGDLDALIGVGQGYTIFFANTGTAASPAFAAPLIDPFGLANVGRYAAPELADIDGDGDLDGFIGENYGDTLFFENTGTSTSPAFATPVANAFGLANVGYAAVPELADVDGDGDLDALIGEFYGTTVFFENTGAQNAPSFAAPTTNAFGLSDVGKYAVPALADIDGDGDLDAFLGERYGNVIFFRNAAVVATPPETATGTVGSGGTVTTETEANGATADDALETTVTTPNPGKITISEGVVSTPSPSGFTLFGRQVSIAAPAATPAEPLIFVFEIDASILPSDTAASAVVVFRNGEAVDDCAGAPGEANPSPCVSNRMLEPDGDVLLTVLTALASEWNFGVGQGTPAGCPSMPEPACTSGFESASLLINELRPGKEMLVVKLSKGPALSQGDFGNPTEAEGTIYRLCLYDDASTAVGQLEVDRAAETCGTKPCWRSIGAAPPAGKGFAYKDGSLSSDGVQTLSLKAGSAGKSKLTLTAKNNAAKGQASLPGGIAAGLTETTSATVQLRTSNAECFSATVSSIAVQESTFFKAK